MLRRQSSIGTTGIISADITTISSAGIAGTNLRTAITSHRRMAITMVLDPCFPMHTSQEIITSITTTTIVVTTRPDVSPPIFLLPRLRGGECGPQFGTATAASLWATGAIGAAIGYGLYDIAGILSHSIYVTFRYAARLKSPAQEPDEHAHRDRK